MRVLVTGSRQWLSQSQLYNELDEALVSWMRSGSEEPFVVVHGGAAGADETAGRWVHDRRGLAPNAPTVEVHPANWNRHGRSLAGNIRNHEMVILGADLVLAFLVPGAANRGTRHCISEAKTWLGFKGVPIKEIWEE